MNSKISRRNLIQTAGVAALAAAPIPEAAAAAMPGPRFESKDTPHICLIIGDGGGTLEAAQAAQAGRAAAQNAVQGAGGGRGAGRGGGRGAGGNGNQEVAAKRIKQLGVDWVIGGGGGGMPWTEERLKASLEQYKSWGLTCGNMMIGVSGNVIYARPDRDKDIANLILSIKAAGKAGLPVIEYNWYAHRIQEGYFEEIGRAGAGWTTFDFDREIDQNGKKIKIKDLPPLENEGAHTADEMWANITYFLKAVIPEAEKAGVRLALHPNDPPAPISRGSQQIMGSVEGWKKLVNIVKSPSNGITFDCGVTREMGGDPVEVARYFGSRDCINHVHFRNVKVVKPYEHYSEVFIDEGENNMFAVMRELVKLKYTHMIYPEHPRRLDYDSERPGFRPQYPGGGAYAAYAFNVGYARAMLQAALTA